MKLEDKLKAVGFNEVEAKVYLALLEKKWAKWYTIIKVT